MKKLFLVPLLALALVGCHKSISAPVPGSINSFDSTSYRTLMDAQAAIRSVQADVLSGKVVLTSTQKQVLNNATLDYNAAEAAWQTYHAGATNDTTTLAAAINQLVSDIAQITSQIRGGK